MLFNKILILDFETRWASKACEWAPDGYTLKKLTTEEYIRSSLFGAFGVSYAYYGENAPAQWVRGKVLQQFFDTVDWSTTAVCCHNAMFDATILTWHYGAVPAFIFDTLSMARALRGIEVGNSAAKLAEEFGLPPKGYAINSTDGLWELPTHVEEELATYCNHDVWLCGEFLDRLLPGYPIKELQLIDATIRMFSQPQLQLDVDLLKKAIDEDESNKLSLLRRLGINLESELSSNEKFANAFRLLGVDPPTKISKTTGKSTYAFSKQDALFQQLINSDNEDIALLCEARLKVKSTQERTRAQRFLDIAGRNNGYLPVPVNYAHTRTLRWGAAKGSNINMQNLKRGGTLRKAIIAKENHRIVAGDLSQIEPRVLAYLSDFTKQLEDFKTADAYSAFGAVMFGVPGLNKKDHPDLRQSAKSAMLGAGYGLGWANFAAQLLTGFLGAPPVRYDKAFAKRLGINENDMFDFGFGRGGEIRLERMAEIPHTCTDEELYVHCVCAKAIIDRYRKASTPVVSFWNFLSRMLATTISVPNAKPVVYKCLVFYPGKIQLPNGLFIHYEGIEKALDKYGRTKYTYMKDKKRSNLYHGIIAENVTSGTARCVIGDGMLRVQKRYQCAMPVHDEGVWVVPDTEVDEALVWIKDQLTKPVSYLPGIPLDATVGAARRYGDAK